MNQLPNMIYYESASDTDFVQSMSFAYLVKLVMFRLATCAVYEDFYLVKDRFGWRSTVYANMGIGLSMILYICQWLTGHLLHFLP